MYIHSCVVTTRMYIPVSWHPWWHNTMYIFVLWHLRCHNGVMDNTYITTWNLKILLGLKWSILSSNEDGIEETMFWCIPSAICVCVAWEGDRFTSPYVDVRTIENHTDVIMQEYTLLATQHMRFATLFCIYRKNTLPLKKQYTWTHFSRFRTN